ncbi:MAG: histidinol-phosphatase HisJ family protein [Anaerolineae bacterium]
MTEPSPITTDYHMHTVFSPDGDDTPAAMCRQAVDIGLSAIALTEHAEWHPVAQPHGFPNADAYFLAVEQCRTEFGAQGLQILTGVELGNPHQYFDEATRLVESYPFDVKIASLHWLNGQNIHLKECFIGRHPYDVYRDYFYQISQLARDFEFDILGHFDRIIWRGQLLQIGFDPYRIERDIRAALATLVKHNRCLELNTRFLDDPLNWNDALIVMLRWYWEAGGTRVVVNSDAHRRHEIGRNREMAQQLLAQADFTFAESYLQLVPALPVTPAV